MGPGCVGDCPDPAPRPGMGPGRVRGPKAAPAVSRGVDPDDPPSDGPDHLGPPGEPPVSLLVLGTIDAMEYEALVDVEEAAAARRRVFEAETDRAAVEVLRGLSADLSQLDRARLVALEGLVTTRLDPEDFRPDGG